jgi:dihydrofolate synthase / folylpolyglutamate synthase
MNFVEAMKWVEEAHAFPSDPARFNADRFRWLLTETGLERDLAEIPTAVVAGSCGKGSTARFLAHIACRSGIHVVLGTKPPLEETAQGHLERYQVSQGTGFRWLSSNEFTARAQELRPAVERLSRERPDLGPPAPYELRAWILVRTAAVQRAGLAVVEANIGLRFDPAGVLPMPAVTLLTPIAFDHGQMLRPPDDYRPDLGERAGPFWHKAGGVWPGSQVVAGRQDPSIHASLPLGARRFADEYGVEDVVCSLEGSQAVLRLGSERRRIKLRALGAFQVENAAHAAAAAQVLHERRLLPGGTEDFWRAVQEGLFDAETPGRLQVLATRPAVLLAPEKTMGLIKALEPLFPSGGRLHICATFLDRVHNVAQAAKAVASFPRVARIVLTRVKDDDVNRDADPELLAAHIGAEVELDPRKAVASTLAGASADDIVLLLGHSMTAAVTSWGGLPSR